MIDDQVDRFMLAASALWRGTVPGADRKRARLEAFDVLEDDDAFPFAVFLASATASLLVASAGVPPGAVVSIAVFDSDRRPASIDDLEPAHRAAWRSVLAGCNGDDPTPPLLCCTGELEAARVTVHLVELFEVGIELTGQTPSEGP